MNQAHHPLVQLARASIETFVRQSRVLRASEAPAGIDGPPAGVFVTLHLISSGELRGCIGTISATEPSLVEETIQMAIAAATTDPRFPQVGSDELADLKIEVSVLQSAERIQSLAELDPRRFGVIVRHKSRRGLLLPDIPGIDDAATQVDMARQKARIGSHEPLEMWRFRVDKYQ